jgi:hypothetical protein
MPDFTEYQKGLRDIREWLQHNDDIAWKINVCKQNYPHDKPSVQPYYNAMLNELEKAQKSK